MEFRYYVPTDVYFGPGKFRNLSQIPLPGKKALIVVSTGRSMKANGYLDCLRRQLTAMGIDYVVFDGIQPNPTKDSVMTGARLARGEGCDFVIGLGGGSTTDSSKIIALLATNDGDYWEYVRAGSGKGKAVAHRPLPVVSISTTSGTGSETDPWAVITNEALREKIGYGGDMTFPAISIFDPELTLTLPPFTTAHQGFDCLFHCAEGCLNRVSFDLSDTLALRAMELIGRHLPEAVQNGSDLEAREGMALANVYSGYVQSMANSIGPHAIEHVMSARHPKLPHGAGLVMIADAYYSYVASQGVRDDIMIRMARALGRKDADNAMAFPRQLRALLRQCGVDQLRMSDYGIRYDDLPDYVAAARAQLPHFFAAEPADFPEADYVEIMRRSYR